ncbi:MAG TPA: branched-chain amino acid ABC transporter substrate-binding protein [Acidiphilium sp.]|uniref:branched-chain amino acid ABC transporter substrate-binding protein n=1 Tax=unclassified Acidiphilium TaxID=2617493 RepID=UPI000BC78BD2|nr:MULTISPECIES: branched-chain amino acid ABC transporter substrate-binding protein [unclassified Acidiphilium]OYV56305.1 MAG: branched chain amino acid ABC transporter substrate-binding protein [Acidiphilium sp. 20-67-58]HQT61100.1 branched-chain amino acid ABC transporter substrate-binding protein [Acidiphilium sp.]HQU10267.1 branched-chain amino acid ABC transporter substrate-binding protein [Acidiphilium sp.]
MALSRRNALRGAAGTVLLASASPIARAGDKVYHIGITLPLTGADAEAAHLILHGAQLAIKLANQSGELGDIRLEPMVLNNATATAGQYDPAQAATNARKLAGTHTVLANVGPEMSGSGKAMAPILSMANLATITPSSTAPDITSPTYAGEFDPGGKPIYFRTVTTDAYQGPNMANFYAEVLKAKSVYILDDSGAYGVGLANAFEAQAKKKGIKVLGRDRLDPKAADYSAVLTKIAATKTASLYYGGTMQAGVKLVKQSYQIIPHVIKGGGDGILSPEMMTAAGFPAAEGWYGTNASPHVVDDPKLANWVALYTKTYGVAPDDYAITGYDAALVAIAGIKTGQKAGKPLTAANVRDAIATVHVNGLQGPISFDKYGDMTSHVVAVFQFHHDKSAPLGDLNKQMRYVGVAPQN